MIGNNVKIVEDKLLVRDATVASFMIKHGCMVVNIAPNKFITNATVFYFANNLQNMEIVKEYFEAMAKMY